MPLAGLDTEGVAMSQVDKISGIEMHRKLRGRALTQIGLSGRCLKADI